VVDRFVRCRRRTPDEFGKAHSPGAINIPVMTLLCPFFVADRSLTRV